MMLRKEFEYLIREIGVGLEDKYGIGLNEWRCTK